MASDTKQGIGKANKVTVKVEEIKEPKKPAKANTAPTLDEMIADPIAFRRYVTRTLAAATPQAPPDLYGDEFRKWKYRHLLTATLKHLLAVFKDEPDPKGRAWQYYQAWLIVNNTDFKESPFMSYASARGLFAQEYSGRRQCQKVVAEFWQKERARALSETASTEGWKWEDEQEHA